MFFDKSYIELICSPEILADEPGGAIDAEAIRWIDQHGMRYEFQ